MSIQNDIKKPYIGDIWEGWRFHGWSSPNVDVFRVTSYSEQPVLWRNELYIPFPIQVESVASERNRAPNRVTLTADNTNNFLLPFLSGNEQMMGFHATRWRTLSKYLDNGTNPNPDMYFPIQRYIVVGCEVVSNSVVRLTMSSRLDRPQARLPRRIILRQDEIPYTVYAPAIGQLQARPR